MLIHQIGPGGYWTGASREISDKQGVPKGWTRCPLPELSQGMFAAWGGQGWTVAATPFAPPAPTQSDVIAERERRLALGFAYDFGDERGVHHIGTTPDDMRKWLDEVTPISQAFINASNPSGEIGIFTETGPVTVTAAEWQQILLAAGNWRQPIYQASFALMAMSPIPADFMSDNYWP